MLIVLDIGNTRWKAALYNQGRQIDSVVVSQGNNQSFMMRLKEWRALDFDHQYIGVKSGTPPPELDFVKWLSYQDVWPFEIQYQTPQTLGVDRLLMASAAVLAYGESVLVVNIGTCITYNVVSNLKFLGGAISPGIAMRYKAMHVFTSSLPEVSQNRCAPLLGQSTLESLQAGVDVAVVKEIEGMIEAYKSEFALNHVILCGGDANSLQDHIKKYIFAPTNYEFDAIYRWYLFSQQNQ